MNIKENEFKSFVKELSDYAFIHKDNPESQFVSHEDAYAAYYIIANIMIMSEADALLFLIANNLLNVYIKEKHALPIIDYYFKNSLAIVIHYANMNNFKNFKINFIDKELLNNNMIIFSIYDLQFSYHAIPLFIKERIPLKYKSHDLFNGVKHKTCISDLYHKVIENRHFLSNLTYKKEPLIEKAYEFANSCSNQPISKSRLKKMLPAYCFNYSEPNKAKIEAVDKYHVENFVGQRYIVSTSFRKKPESFDKVLTYMKSHNGILVNIQSDADYLLVQDTSDLKREAGKLNKYFNGKILILNSNNFETTTVNSDYFQSLKAKAIEQENKIKTQKRLQKMWGEFYRANAERASLEENESRLATISATLKQNENDLVLAIELIKAKGFIPCDKIGMSSYIFVKDEEDLRRLSSTFKYPYQGQFIKLK